MVLDVPLSEAMFVWNSWVDGGGAVVVAHPDTLGLARGYNRAVGACFGNPGEPREGDDRDWPRMSNDARLKVLLAAAWQAVFRDGASHQSVHAALLVIPEFRALMTPDMIPEEYQYD